MLANVVPSGLSPYSVTEQAVPDWQTSSSCGRRQRPERHPRVSWRTSHLHLHEPQVGKLEVRKRLLPSTDSGRFDLRIDGQTEKAGAGDGDSTGERTVGAGTHDVSELAAAAPRSERVQRLDRVPRPGRSGAVVASAQGLGPLDVPVAGRGRRVRRDQRRARSDRDRKDAVPNDPQDFDFTAGGGLSPASFQLDDDPGDAHTAELETFTVTLAAATRSPKPCLPAGI